MPKLSVASGAGLTLMPECRYRADTVILQKKADVGVTVIPAFRYFPLTCWLSPIATSRVDVYGVSLSTTSNIFLDVQCKEVQDVCVCVSLFTPRGVDVQGVSIYCTVHHQQCGRVGCIHVWTYRVYPFTPPAVWTSRVYSSPFPAV